MDIGSFIGVIGLILILLAFALNLFHYLSQKSISYNLINIFGSAFLTYYAFLLDSIPFLLLQIIWGLLSIVKLFQIIVKSKKLKK